MSARPVTKRLLCVNCNICVNKLRRHPLVQLDARVVSLISNSISPVIVTDEDYICESCFISSMRAVNAETHGSGDRCAGSFSRCHMGICLVCGKSLVNRQNHLVLNPNPSNLIQMIFEIIENRIAPRLISPPDRICHACWLKTKRDVTRRQTLDESRCVHRKPLVNVTSANHVSPIQDNMENQFKTPDIKVEVIQEYSDEVALDTNKVPLKPIQNESKTPVLNTSITLPNYKRGPNTASHCIFMGCDHITSLHTVSDHLRATLIYNYKYYIPKFARICVTHLQNNNWDSLYYAENSMSTFTADQIEHVFSFVNAYKPFIRFK